MCANRGNIYGAHKYRVFSRCGVSQWFRGCTDLLYIVSVTLPKNHELLGQRPRALFGATFYLAELILLA